MPEDQIDRVEIKKMKKKKKKKTIQHINITFLTDYRVKIKGSEEIDKY